MDIIRAKELLQILADGVNPLTGEVLPAEDSCNQPEIIRALNAVLAAISEKKPKNQPENAGKPWISEDDALLVKMFDEGQSDKELCTFFKRSKGAIAARLVRLGKITDRNTYYSR